MRLHKYLFGCQVFIPGNDSQRAYEDMSGQNRLQIDNRHLLKQIVNESKLVKLATISASLLESFVL